MTIHNAKDNSFKRILAEPELFVDFIKDYVRIDFLKDITPEDIEDMTERFLPLFQENKDSDTVKKINLKGNVPLFVIAIVEHESQVNHRASFKMLQYITLVLTEYEKDANKENQAASRAKDFKFPPVLPIVFYDGEDRWTAKTNFLDKTEFSEVFQKYIPKFEYELVSLNKYDIADLVQFENALSLIMIIDKIRTADGMSLLSKLPSDYVTKQGLNIPEHLKKLLADVITLLLKRINVPDNEIDDIAKQLYERRFQEMFALIEKYDVQETRRIALKKGIEQGIEEMVLEMKKDGLPEERIAKITKLSIERIHEILS